MSIQSVDVGSLPNDGTGDALRLAFQKINANFTQFASVAFTGSYTSLSGTPTFSPPAFSGQYTDLQGLPQLGSLAFYSTINNSNWLGIPLAIQNGGTGQTSAIAAFAALCPLTSPGDLLYMNAGGHYTRLPIGANGQQLSVVSNLPQWQASLLPGTPYGTLQYNSSGNFTGAAALLYSNTGTYLTIQSQVAAGVPLKIQSASGQTGDLLDFTANNGSLLSFFAANGGLYVQGAPAAAGSVELNNLTVAARIFDCKLANGAYGPYFEAVDEAHIQVFAANGQSLQSLGLGNTVTLYADNDGECHQRNTTHPQNFKCHNVWYDTNNWERCGFDWKTSPNVCRIGSEAAGNGVSRDVHFHTNGVECLKIDAFQNIVCGNGGLTTAANTGHHYIPSCAGSPTSTPTNYNGMCAHVVDRTGNKLWFYIPGTGWKGCALT
jgi:hypothetical protein